MTHSADCDAPRKLTVWCSSCLPGRPCFVHEPEDCSPPPDPKTTVSNTADGCPVTGRTSQEVGVMPKEITYSDQPSFIATTDGHEHPEGSDEAAAGALSGGKWRRRGVVVGWTKGTRVEIGTASFDPARQMPSNGVFMSLDRDGINRLIRSLRKARDAAFGADA